MPDNPVIRATKKPGGRKPGQVNKVSSTVKDAFQQAFDLTGGPEQLAAWAMQKVKTKQGVMRPNLGAFYELAAKLIPSESRVSGTTDHRHYVAREIAVERREALPVQAPPAARLGGIDPAPVDAEVIAGGSAPLNQDAIVPDNGTLEAPENWL